MTIQRQNKFKNLLEELHKNKEKVTRIESKRQSAKEAIQDAKILKNEAQIILDQMTNNYQRRIKTFQLLDEILAEFRLSVKARADQKKKAQKQAKRMTRKNQNKKSKHTLEDIIACLDALPANQKALVLKAMEKAA